MEAYKEIIDWYNSTLLFKLSTIGIALNCNVIFTTRLELLTMNKSLNVIKYLKDGDKIFINLHDYNPINNLIETIFSKIKDMNIKVNFYLLAEPNVSEEIIEFLLPISHKIYCLNNNYSHPNVYCIPIGIRDCGVTVRPQHQNFYHYYLFNEGLKNVKKENLCLFGGFGMSHPNRYSFYDYFKNKDFVYDISDLTYDFNMTSQWGKIPVFKYYNFINKSHYTLAPHGLGVDTHRFFEAIYLKSIPIVKKTNSVFDKLYDFFPCLVVNDWNEVTKDLLISTMEINKKRMDEFHLKYPNIYTNISVLDDVFF